MLSLGKLKDWMGLEIETELSIGVDVELGMRGRRCDLRNRVAFVEAVS